MTDAAETDADLLRAWADGNKSAGEQLFERHFEAIARFFRNKLTAEAQHEDLIQQTFLGCVEARDRFRGDASFRSFLFAIAHNQLGKHWRSRRRDRLDFPEVLRLHQLI
jgi:RNA polymerase sigma-70 factor (ECF subfamily)